MTQYYELDEEFDEMLGDPVDAGLDESEVSDLERLLQLKQQAADIQKEVDYLTEVYLKRLDGMKGRVRVSGGWVVVAVRPKPRVSIGKESLARLQEVNEELYGRVTERTATTSRIRNAMRLGYFAEGTPEAGLLTQTVPSGHLRFSCLPRSEGQVAS